ncbi:MAG TPA: SAM-dependent methyltransferase, partial [Actinomycetes bacterium]
VIRAGLVAEAAALVDGTLLDPTIAYVTSERLEHTPFLTAYEITDVLPFQLKRLRALLRSRDVGRLTVKKRGSAVEPETLRRQLRLSGEGEATVVLTRVAGEPTVLLVRRVDAVRAGASPAHPGG